MNLAEITSKIIQDPLFLRLKDVIENNGYHNAESVFDHLIKTKDTAQREISGDFITNPEAKNSFLEFIAQDISGIKRADIIVLTALLHDIGKLLKTEENGQTKPLLVTDINGTTFCPGHEYWGSTIVGEFTKDLPQQVIQIISTVISLHDSFNENYWDTRKDWPLEQVLNDVKSRAEGFYKEALFNIYCDCFTAKTFDKGKKMIIKVLSEPSLYIERKYVI